MECLDQYQLRVKAEELRERIEKGFGRYGVNMRIPDWRIISERFIFRVKLKGNAREAHLQARMADVQLKLKLPIFQLTKHNFDIFIVAADHKIVYDHLPKILSNPACVQETGKMQLPYVVGFDSVGELVIIDLCEQPHLLLGGSSNSGKTSGLQSLITNITYSKSPRQVNLILIDLGATDLMLFNKVPHLSCPVVNDRDTACQVLTLLNHEMERRKRLQIVDPNKFGSVPRLVLVIDEFQALFTGLEDKRMSKTLVDSVSSLLQRGRHAKIHVVLAAQNPTFQNMRVDLGNITARVAFKCAKKNFSETILGEAGAENLSGQGDMYLKTPQYDGLRRIQGVYISPEELSEMVFRIQNPWRLMRRSDLGFIIKKSDLVLDPVDDDNLTGNSAKKKNVDDKKFAKVVFWVLGQDSVSCNMLQKVFKLGWNRASGYIERLNSIGVVDDLDSKLPRSVIPQRIEEIPEAVMEILLHNGISLKEIEDVINRKGES